MDYVHDILYDAYHCYRWPGDTQKCSVLQQTWNWPSSPDCFLVLIASKIILCMSHPGYTTVTSGGCFITHAELSKRMACPYCPICRVICVLTHWGRLTHICVSKLTIIGSDNGFSPGRRQAIIWTNAEILLIRPLGANFSEILIEIYTILFKKIHLKVSSAKWRPFCLGLNELI